MVMLDSYPSYYIHQCLTSSYTKEFRKSNSNPYLPIPIVMVTIKTIDLSLSYSKQGIIANIVCIANDR